MTLRRRVWLQGLRYRGGLPMVVWLLHRITGLGILLFVGMHVIAAFFLQQFGNDVAIAITSLYESWPFQIVVYFCVLYHALNGLRVTILDIWPQLLEYQREAIWIQLAIFIPIYGLTIFIMIQNGLIGG
ncbi:MAG TPA: hypothetical protein G4O02_13520 [Caldilineae bacterium]|nr:hypothetical protein [Caldilineae bacterium]